MAQVTYVIYARPTVNGAPHQLRAKIVRGEASGRDAPVLVWLHGGDFTSGKIDSAEHDRLAQDMASFGYTSIFVEYRLGATEADLRPETRTLLPELQADAACYSRDLPSEMTGAAALAAMEDGAAFLAWLDDNRMMEELSNHILLGGALAGGMTVLNLLHIAPRVGLSLPPIANAVVLTGAFAYPSFFSPSPTPVLALHGSRDRQIAPFSIRSYAYLAGPTCRYVESAEHISGTFRMAQAEAERRSLRRVAMFDRGTEVAVGRVDHPDRVIKDKYQICLFTCVRNEGPFLLEWIAHNQAIGVTHFLIFTNDCDDGTTELLDALQARGIVTHVRNPSTELDSRQHLNISIACARFARVVRRADFAILSDVDEFIQINVADGTLNGLIAAAGHPDVISLSEQLFGFGGVEAFENRLVTAQFRVSEPELVKGDKPSRRGVKSIMRVSTCIDGLANHRPRIPAEEAAEVEWVDGSGAAVAQGFRVDGGRGIDARGRMGLARVNHYTLRSAESLLVKFERGDAARGARMNPTYFTKRNGQGARNDGIEPALPALKDALAALLSDPEILRLQRHCVDKHAEKIAALKADPAFAEIWAAILAELGADQASEATRTAAE